MSKINDFIKYHKGYGKLADNTNAPDFKTAMKELNSKKGKQGHWSWYIFPTNKGSRQFNDKFKLSPTEVKLYLSNPMLRDHYARFMLKVSKRLDDGMDPRTLLMSNVDVRKTYDSAQLFKRVANKTKDVPIYIITKAVILRLNPYIRKLNQEKEKRKPMMALFSQLKHVR